MIDLLEDMPIGPENEMFLFLDLFGITFKQHQPNLFEEHSFILDLVVEIGQVAAIQIVQEMYANKTYFESDVYIAKVVW